MRTPAAAATFQAVWPETARSELPHRFPAWRGSAQQTVAHLATGLFVWRSPSVRRIHSHFNLAPGTQAFAVSATAESHAIEVHAARVVDARHWSVTYLWGFGRQEPAASVSIAAGKASVAVDYWGRSRMATLLLHYGNGRLQKAARHAASWSVPIDFPLNATGAVIVLFRDNTGVVYTGWGTPLPAGPFAAG